MVLVELQSIGNIVSINNGITNCFNISYEQYENQENEKAKKLFSLTFMLNKIFLLMLCSIGVTETSYGRQKCDFVQALETGFGLCSGLFVFASSYYILVACLLFSLGSGVGADLVRTSFTAICSCMSAFVLKKKFGWDHFTET